MIEVRNLTRKYGTFTAVNSVSFTIPQGQIVGLLGHNGAGKTTTLKILTGFLEATSGSVHIDGMSIDDHRLAIQSRIGYLPENSPLYPEMTVVEYLSYVAEMRGLPTGQWASAIREAVAATELGPKLMSKIETLSKGYRQRVGVAQAILHKPEILILDEPTNGLDPTQILAMRHLIKNLAKAATVIVSTHILTEVEAICDRALIILDGRLAVDSQLSDLRRLNTITLTAAAPAVELSAKISHLAGVKKVTAEAVAGSPALTQLTIEATDAAAKDLAPTVAAAVIHGGWALHGLEREHRDLETVFKEVNGANVAASARSQAGTGQFAHSNTNREKGVAQNV